ncbi:CRISPR-associated helicase Cas3' [Camelliibacillus cellulosilyticus]|uniref:CRISPR-associated helicase Cas3 n=1 Tax=Camelliibacillus cellulosilyticus TaxID=2174486 RepID=A0ABV9GSF1_9BACL
MESIAHIRQSDGKVQTIEEHLSGVKALSSQFGSKIGAEHIAGLAGMLHDMGKYSNEFREYILEAVNNPESPPKKGSVDHSTAGGKLLFEALHSDGEIVPYKIIAEIIGNVIISHHSGLQDFLTPDLDSDYLKRVNEKNIEKFEEIKTRFFESVINKPEFKAFIKQCEDELLNYIKRNISPKKAHRSQLIFMFLTKYIFSCLIDADRTDTRCFEERTLPNLPSGQVDLFKKFYGRLMKHIENLNQSPHSHTLINRLRAEMSTICDDFAERPSGIYTLSIPTGGGKTLASLRYALKHAIKHNKDRIIYVVPYTTIIEQNADEVKKILKDSEHLLEHHSNIVEDTGQLTDSVSNDKEKLLKLAKDNWDAPIIFTTMVQYLNVFYSKGTRNIRRLHNLSNAILIFDEVQSVPIRCISLFNESLNFLRDVCNSSILLCTATQPALDFVEKRIDSIDGEIVKSLNEVTQAFKRVNIVDKMTDQGWNTESLSEFVKECLDESPNVLVILNTKTVVKKLYKELVEKQPELKVFHLSTLMCAAHRKDILQKVKDTMKKGEKVVCLSTQLIEAGVDISFDCVIRSLAGLDSIAQAAGRCNRHGEHDIRNVYIINHNEEVLDKLKTIKIGADIAKQILIDKRHDENNIDLLSPATMKLYFKNYYNSLKEDLDYFIPELKQNMYNLLNENKDYKSGYLNKNGQPFGLILNTSIKTAAKYFEVIDSPTTTILVPYKDGAELIADFNEVKSIGEMYALMKKAQQYAVNVFEHEKEQLIKNGNMIYLLDGKIACLRENAYDLGFGVDLEGEGAMDTHFI